jgi:hypothetical protein
MENNKKLNYPIYQAIMQCPCCHKKNLIFKKYPQGHMTLSARADWDDILVYRGPEDDGRSIIINSLMDIGINDNNEDDQ